MQHIGYLGLAVVFSGVLVIGASIIANQCDKLRLARILILSGVSVSVFGWLLMNLEGYKGIYELPRIALPVVVFVWAGYMANRSLARRIKKSAEGS